jgi:hypothetical protein
LLTIETWLRGVGRKAPVTECPAWPPDLFALAGYLVHRSGAYLRVFEHSQPASFLKGIPAIAQKWRDALDAVKGQPITADHLRRARLPEIREGWAMLMRQRELPITAINENKHLQLAQQLIRLTLLADEASCGIGVSWDDKAFLSMAGKALSDSKGRTYGWDVPYQALGVLGKQHTPAKGATFRSLTHHLALYNFGEIEARWTLAPAAPAEGCPPRHGLNLLLLPWPEQVQARDFQEVSHGITRPDDTEAPGYFRYDPAERETPEDFGKRLERALDVASQHADPIDAIVFPEQALTEPEYDVAEQIAFAANAILIAGVRQARPAEVAWDDNVSVLQVAGAVRAAAPNLDNTRLKELRLYQAKHHRWYLDRSQIVSYQLAGALSASRGAWEHIELRHPRVLHFATVDATTWSVLICEDLARQDPAADLIRAVGPNLLIALLMDGPQLSRRWPARYAAVLAEDPGTSVLTLTSLGMAKRSRPMLSSGQRAPASRVIALWRDAFEGEIQIALDPGHNAGVLSLEYRMETEYCADGRTDHGQTRYPVYAGYYSFNTGDAAQH